MNTFEGLLIRGEVTAGGNNFTDDPQIVFAGVGGAGDFGSRVSAMINRIGDTVLYQRVTPGNFNQSALQMGGILLAWDTLYPQILTAMA